MLKDFSIAYPDLDDDLDNEDDDDMMSIDEWKLDHDRQYSENTLIKAFNHSINRSTKVEIVELYKYRSSNLNRARSGIDLHTIKNPGLVIIYDLHYGPNLCDGHYMFITNLKSEVFIVPYCNYIQDPHHLKRTKYILGPRIKNKRLRSTILSQLNRII